MINNIKLEEYETYTQAPAEEPARQYFYMNKCKALVDKLAEELGRKPTCCVNTFGCPTV